MSRLFSTITCAAILVAPIVFSATQAKAGEVLNRDHQHPRLENGIKNAPLNLRESNNLEHQETVLTSTAARPSQQIVEAQGIRQDANGVIYLVVDPASPFPHSPALIAPSCGN